MSAVVWNAGAPPKRGVYRVKSDAANQNAGYRHWNGERWGALVSARKWAQNADTTRRMTLKYPVLWASPAPAPTIASDEFDAMLLAYRYAEAYKMDSVKAKIIALIDARLK